MSLLDKSASKDQLIDILNSMKFPIMGAGGGFAPIGTEAYFEGTTAPEGWLLCDGSVLNIADYPDLATYYASHYGASNHFGGDGVTTFAVPIKEGMPDSGIYDTSEHIVGVWKKTVDGVLKQKPLYRISIFGTSPSSTNEVQTGLTNIDEVFLEECHITGSGGYRLNMTYQNDTIDVKADGSTIWFSFPSGSAYANRPFEAIVRYAKSTDSWTLPTLGHSADGNGVFCIKATVSGNPNGHVYSTEEQVVGTWVDGSDIYEKTVIGLSKQTTWASQYSASFSITDSELGISSGNIERILLGNCYAEYQGDNLTYTISNLDTNPTTHTHSLAIHDSVVVTGVTLRYTKSS